MENVRSEPTPASKRQDTADMPENDIQEPCRESILKI